MSKSHSYEQVAASQTAQALGGTGAVGDQLHQLIIIPESTSPGLVTLLDGAVSIPLFDGGASSIVELKPWAINIGGDNGWTSHAGPWKITTGAAVRVVAHGIFTN